MIIDIKIQKNIYIYIIYIEHVQSNPLYLYSTILNKHKVFQSAAQQDKTQ